MSYGVFLSIRRYLLVFLASIFLSLHYASILFVNSSLLGNFFLPIMVSALYVFGAIGNIFLFFRIPGLLKRFSKRQLFISLLTIEAIGTAGLALTHTPLVAGISFILITSVLGILYYLLDIFLEEMSLNNHTGEIRGLYLSFINVAVALAPLLIAGLVLGTNFTRVYLLALTFLAPIFLAFVFFPRLGVPSSLPRRATGLTFKTWWRSNDVRRVVIARFVLTFFYAIMMIYTPLYLRGVLGFEWSEIGIMFSIMLLPFVIFEWPMGELGDRFWGEKEIMILGFFITGSALLFMPFLDKTFLFWTIALFVSRIGASFIEISTESYFFKKVDSEDSEMISIFRLTTPTGTIIGATVGTFFTSLLAFNTIFFLLAIVVFLGMRESAYIKDTL